LNTANPKSMDSRPLGSHSIVALIPARAGSKRVPGKNMRLLAGKPLIQHTIDLAKSVEEFTDVIVSTDDVLTKILALAAGCAVHDRQVDHATDTAPDYLWVSDVLAGRTEDLFCILRPTSPFRTRSTIRRAYAELIASEAHSIRGVRPVREHPGKMWAFHGRMMRPLVPNVHPDLTPWHSSPTQTLPPYYVQTASIEIGWRWMVAQTQTISGHLIAPFLCDHLESLDINSEDDFTEAERLARLFDGRSDV
jgi:CMP-N,N'-diacetyllegionaminic acid synthase